MSESQAWRDTADEIFASFGDVVKDATVTKYSPGAYDAATGTQAQTATTIETRAVPTAKSRDYIAVRDSYSSDLRPFMVRGSDFSARPPVNAEFVYDPDGANETYKILRVEADDAGVGAYWVVYGASV